MKTIFLAMTAVLLSFSAYAAEVEFHTTHGMMVIDVDEENAPITADNFLQYVKDGFYDGVIFHRVIPGFVIQGGGFTKDMEQKKTREPILHEGKNGLKNLEYTLSMARTSDPNSGSSQFFINLNDNPPLDPSPGNPGYAVFGKVTEGTEVVKAIAAEQTANVGHFSDVPVEPIIITKAIVRQ